MNKLGYKIATIVVIALIISVVPATSSKMADTNLSENIDQNLTSNENRTNDKFKDKTNKQLISEFEKNLAELNEISKTQDNTVIANYSDQELKKMRSEVEQLNISAETKDSLLDKVDAALEKNNQALQFLLEGNEKQAKNMLKAENNILKALINEISAQNGKEISTSDAEKLIQHVEKIRKGIEEGSQWILQENPDMKITADPELLVKIESKVAQIREIIIELQVRGVPVEVKAVDASEFGNKLPTGKINEKKYC